VAIVAKNGSGKTTLLRCLMDLEQIDSGRVVYRNDIRVAFMEQTENMDESQTILESIFDHDLPELKALKKYNEALIDNDQDKLNECYEELTELNAWDYEVRVNQILSVLKLTDSKRLIGSLSGGQKKRVALAKALLSDADFMILDEPTNHLDLDMIEWLESYLSTSKSTLLMVTHDRYFLEVVCDTIFELSDETLYQYKGNFSYYLEKKAAALAAFNSEVDKAKNLFTKELEWMRRMPKARSTKAKSRIDGFYEVKEKASQRIIKEEVQLSVKMNRLGGKILELIKISKGYGEKTFIEPFTYTFIKGEKIGIVGKNGCGKSTLLKMIMGELAPDTGKIITGDTVVFGYYSQEGMKLAADKRVIEIVKDVAEVIPLADGSKLTASQFLQLFLFPPEMQYTYVSKLSGGEKRRLYLLTVLMKNPNFLILDEPTNDLDIQTLNILQDFLEKFGGCVIIVSHDRFFMDTLADHLFVFEGDGIIRDYNGKYNDYRQELAEKQKVTYKQPDKKSEIVEIEAKPKPKVSFKETHEFSTIEKEIPQLEIKIGELTKKLNGGITDHVELQKIAAEISKYTEELEQKTLRWLELSEKM
jgi:ATP-binding cassette subfamily F protein uup